MPPIRLGDDLSWEERESPVPLDGGEVQVWRTFAELSGEEMDGYRALLSPAELERMNRMRAGLPRDEFVVGRGLLRRLVGGALRVDAQTLVFGTGARGKPEISGVQFNVSHSKGVVLIALCRDAAIGIDVEWMDGTIEALDIARQSFSAEEYERILRLSEERDRTRAFYESWVRKESVAKALGEGLTMNLKGFTVPLSGGETRVEFERGERQDIFVNSIPLGENFLGAIALNRKGRSMRYFQVEGSRSHST